MPDYVTVNNLILFSSPWSHCQHISSTCQPLQIRYCSFKDQNGTFLHMIYCLIHTIKTLEKKIQLKNDRVFLTHLLKQNSCWKSSDQTALINQHLHCLPKNYFELQAFKILVYLRYFRILRMSAMIDVGV